MACSRFQGSIHILIVFLLVCSGILFSHSPETQVPGTAENKPYAPSVYTGPAPPLGRPVSGKHNHVRSHPRRNLGTGPDCPLTRAPRARSSTAPLSPSASAHTHSRRYSLAFIPYHCNHYLSGFPQANLAMQGSQNGDRLDSVTPSLPASQDL